MFTAILRGRTASGRPATAAMLEHIHAIIRAAVNAAVRERLIGDDPARYVELPPARRPHAVVRTDDPGCGGGLVCGRSWRPGPWPASTFGLMPCAVVADSLN
jgi:hypothetical protein